MAGEPKEMAGESPDFGTRMAVSLRKSPGEAMIRPANKKRAAGDGRTKKETKGDKRR
jgi:hypothetical protein